MTRSEYPDYCKGCASYEYFIHDDNEEDEEVSKHFDVDECGMWVALSEDVITICPCYDCLVKMTCDEICDKVKSVWKKAADRNVEGVHVDLEELNLKDGPPNERE